MQAQNQDEQPNNFPSCASASPSLNCTKTSLLSIEEVDGDCCGTGKEVADGNGATVGKIHEDQSEKTQTKENSVPDSTDMQSILDSQREKGTSLRQELSLDAKVVNSSGLDPRDMSCVSAANQDRQQTPLGEEAEDCKTNDVTECKSPQGFCRLSGELQESARHGQSHDYAAMKILAGGSTDRRH